MNDYITVLKDESFPAELSAIVSKRQEGWLRIPKNVSYTKQWSSGISDVNTATCVHFLNGSYLQRPKLTL